MSETGPADHTMSTSTATSKESERAEERRGSPRETLRRYVVLVFFGEDNWGKLTNMSESGMAFEFAKPPSLEERVNFTFQAMGCMPMPRNGKTLGDSFEAPGRIVWTREFERGAGVQFVDLAEASREQIRQWLSFETSTETSTNPSPRAQRAKAEVQPILAELLSPLAPGPHTQGAAADKKESLVELDMPVPIAETIPEPDSAFLESSAGDEPYEARAWSDQEAAAKEQRVPEVPVTSHPSVARLTFLVVSGCLAAFAVTAGVRIFMTRAAQQADAAVHTSDPKRTIGEAAAEGNVTPPTPTPVSSPTALVVSSAAGSAPPFQVDVVDADGRNWILWFVHGGAKNTQSQFSSRAAGSSNSSPPTMRTTKRQEEVSAEKPQVTHTFTLAAPNVSHPAGSSSSSNPPTDVPAIQPELTPSLGGTIGGALGHGVVPAPAAPAVHAPIGGMVQQPRLIRSVPPIYPQLAKSMRLSGDVVVDALIDATGNVTAVKVISGPVLLQQSAMETVRQWKYEPARLDGQAVSMHLTVTVRFHLN